MVVFIWKDVNLIGTNSDDLNMIIWNTPRIFQTDNLITFNSNFKMII